MNEMQDLIASEIKDTKNSICEPKKYNQTHEELGRVKKVVK